MVPTRHLFEFLITVYILILIPGPSVLFVVSRGMALGRRAALATVAGNASGFALQLALDRKQLAALFAPEVRAAPNLHRDRAAVRRRLGDRLGHGAGVARPVLAPARVDDRGRRRDADRARVRPRAHQPQELSGR
jgi:hypothetical protein